MKIEFSNKINYKNLIICVFDNFKDDDNFKEIDKELDGYLTYIVKSKNFKGAPQESFTSQAPKKYKEISLFGLGKEEDLKENDAISLGGNILNNLKSNKIVEASVLYPKKGADIAYGVKLKNYSFNKYKSSEKLESFVAIKNITFVARSFIEDENEFSKLELLADSVNFTRDLVTEPSNVLFPDSISKLVKNELSKFGIKIKILNEKDMKKLGMNALLAVGQGSVNESKLVVMEYNGGKKGEQPLAFVGKGVTFDTGGISLKPAAGMEKMKYDMAGSAVVVGLMRALAARKAKVNVVAVVGYAENMPDGNAQRPGDVVRAMNGNTIEVLNTDAEGRLVLADALWYTQDKYKPKLMVNLATLTGAIIHALGSEHAGLFSNSDKLSDQLIKSGLAVEEKVWRLPLNNNYDKDIDSEIADVRNTSKTPGAGSITAAQFLQRFTNKVDWAHIDIAGVTWADAAKTICPKGATGFGVRLLNNFVEENYE